MEPLTEHRRSRRAWLARREGCKAGVEVARKGRARRFREARELKQGFDDGLFREGSGSLADVNLDGEATTVDDDDEWDDDDPLDDDPLKQDDPLDYDPLKQDDNRRAS
jgi:hypothetical protein